MLIQTIIFIVFQEYYCRNITFILTELITFIKKTWNVKIDEESIKKHIIKRKTKINSFS